MPKARKKEKRKEEMKIPKRIKIGGHQYEVFFPYQFTEVSDVIGQSDVRLRRILISDKDGNGETRPGSDILATLLHEIVHAIDSVYCRYQLGIECNVEDVVESLAQGWMQVLIDNPELLTLIQRVKQDMDEKE